MKVSSPGVWERVSGTSLGGGTYWGLCRLLTKCATYEEVLDIAETGDASEVDMLVRDIYGGGYEGMNLNASMVASSFGKLVMKENPRDGVKEEDLAIALLMMITNNIGQVTPRMLSHLHSLYYSPIPLISDSTFSSIYHCDTPDPLSCIFSYTLCNTHSVTLPSPSSFTGLLSQRTTTRLHQIVFCW